MSSFMTRKATAILNADGVRQVDAQRFTVQGANGKYVVQLGANEACTCPAMRSCSHLLAARAWSRRVNQTQVAA